MIDQDALPPLLGSTPAGAVENAASETCSRLRKRARPRAPSVFSNSSDPAIFSSDDDPSVDNYTEGRRKKRYLGSWFQRTHAVADDGAPSPRPKRPFTRQNADSGICMGSDDLDDIVPDQLPIPKPRVVPLVPRIVSWEDNLAGRRIREFVDAGRERVDLSSMGLSCISSDTIKALSEFSTTIPLISKGVPFEQRDPEIELYLSSNSLRTLPRALFDVSHLTTLSLRNNKLTELPPAIGQLRNLKNLNIAQNCLRFLPAELLNLVANIQTTRLLHFHAHPNPFLQPFVKDGESGGVGVEEFTVNLRPIQPEALEFKATVLHPAFYRTRSPVQMSDVHGCIYSKFQLKDVCSPVPVSNVVEEAPLCERGRLQPCPASRVPTLTDIAMRACYNSPSLQHIPAALNGFPRLQNLGISLISHREAGEVWCASCGRQLGVPKTRWLEWWALTKMQPRELSPQATAVEQAPRVWRQTLLNSDPDEKFIPFLRQGCSWKCLPRDFAIGTWYHET